MSEQDRPVLIESRGRLGVITLNRPRAINALTHEMVEIIARALRQWRDAEQVSTVAIVGSGDRGLCAGGDVVALHRAARENDLESAARFWRDEYRMNAMIARYPKPIVAVQDGLVLGGGIGLSAHASHRVVTERSRLGLPEVTIGFVPDVGSTWLLSRAPAAVGVRMALSAEHIGAADAIFAGLSDHLIASDRVPALLHGLETEEPATVIALLAKHVGAAPIADRSGALASAFAEGDVNDIVTALREIGEITLADRILEKSPLALSVTLESLRRARDLELEAVLEQEFIVSMNALVAPDFAEGIRAQVIEKDRAPRWQPPTLAGVTPAEVDGYFTAGAGGTLNLVPSLSSKETS
ncbi:enoyl-CoA hydratase/isomerase family protein [Microbacterium sp. NPDC058062]|uniref:enoyl-CoA hydratase/isomerase family protein n=1 Tax=Microbacterium sp. NPDC058062 TaxID=3346320 RepID=UPI0036DAAD3D